jgi:PTS system nitrogen regulatory IIA component
VAAAHGLEAPRLVQILLDRERLGSTAVDDGVAIPHGRLPGLPALAAAFGRSRAGVDFRSADGKKTHLFFALFAPENSAGTHLKALARISRLCRLPTFRAAILAAPDAAAIFRLLEVEDGRE